MKTSHLTTLMALVASMPLSYASNTTEENNIPASLARSISPVLKDLDDQDRIELFLRKKNVGQIVLSILMQKKTREAKELELYRYSFNDKAQGYLDLYEQACEETKKK